MPKQVSPPRESPKVTIANLNLQVKLLTQRCVELVTSRDQETNHALEYRRQRDDALARSHKTEGHLNSIKATLAATEASLYHLCGYQERVREGDKHRYGDLTGPGS